MSELLPLFVNLHGRRVLLVGGGPVAASKLTSLVAAGANVTVVAPEIHAEIETHAEVEKHETTGERDGTPVGTPRVAQVAIVRRAFVSADLDRVWLVVAAATPAVNRAVAEAADERCLFVNAVDDPSNASAFLSGVVRRDGVTIGISTSGDAPGLTALMREAIDALLPAELGEWMTEAGRQRATWKRDGVPMPGRRPLLLQALNRLYGTTVNARLRAGTTDALRRGHAERNRRRAAAAEPAELFAKSTSPSSSAISASSAVDRSLGEGVRGLGHVSIVGAGPGDPGLLTRTAVARLRAADLVLYDALVNERILRLARRAQRFFVGKRAGRHALSQTVIHAVMIRAARRGRRVVRLKGGDPFVFGRGGEEALALKQARVPFDVVPGVTSVVAAPALAGIPVTHRGVASAFLVVSGHDEQAFATSIGELTPNGMTVVVLMGLTRRAGLAAALIQRGWAAGTPAALLAEASTPQQDVWRGSLGDLAAGRADVASDGPALLVVGAVAALRAIADGADSPVHQDDLSRIEQCL
jgi:uroporphyrin-III C-methyltransferase/precorrin-2 dehydrogenase/sirohydrochlorin ferrochelatase